MYVYGVWYMNDEGRGDLEGLFSTTTKARNRIKRLLKDGYDEDPFFITKMKLDDKEEWQWDLKGEMVI